MIRSWIGRFRQKPQGSARPLLSALNQELTDLIREVLPSTVTISGFSRDLSEDSQGSGWIYAADLVVTNHHVVEGMHDPLTVQPVGQLAMEGRIVGCDPDNDIALVHVPGLAGKPLALERSSPQLGELCLAIGTPHSFRESASLGIISGVSRQIRSPGGGVIEEMIQTDASVNPGNSGGPLLNMHGRVLGMNTLGHAETVNMAVPAETLMHVLPELRDHGCVVRATLGISISMAELTTANGIRRALTVRKVRNEGETALKRGDVLIEINGQPVHRRIDVVRTLGRQMVNERVQLLIERDGAQRTIEVLAREKD